MIRNHTLIVTILFLLLWAWAGVVVAVTPQTEEEVPPNPLDLNLRLQLDKPEYSDVTEAVEKRVERAVELFYDFPQGSSNFDNGIRHITHAGLPALGVIDARFENAPLRVRIGLTKSWVAVARQNDKAGELTLYRLLLLLQDPSWEVRELALQAVAEFNRPDCVGYLIDSLDDAVWRVRMKAISALGDWDDPAIAPLIFNRLQTDSDRDLKAEYVRILGGYGYEPAREMFYDYLDNPNVELSISSLGALIKIDGTSEPRLREGLKQMIQQFDRIGTDRTLLASLTEALVLAGPVVLEPLFDRYRTENVNQIQNAIASVIDGIEDDAKYAFAADVITTQGRTSPRLDRCVKMLGGGPEPTVIPLIKTIMDSVADDNVKVRVINVLRSFSGEEAQAFVLSLLDLPSISVKQAVLSVMTYNASPTYVPRLSEMLSKKNATLQDAAATALKKCIGDDLPTLLKLYETVDNQSVKQNLMNGIVTKSVGSTEETAGLLREFFTVQMENSDVNMRCSALEGLGRLQAVDLRGKLQKMSLDRDEIQRVRAVIINILIREEWLDVSSKPAFEHAMLSKNRSNTQMVVDAIQGLSKFPDRDVWDLFVKRLETEQDPSVRERLSRVIPKISEPEWLPELYPLLDHRINSVRQNFLRVFQKETDPEIVPYLHKFIEKEQAPDQLNRAYNQLAKLKDPRSKDLFLKLLKEEQTPSLRRQAIVFAGHLQMREAVPFIHKDLKEDNRYLRTFCIDALAKIKDPSSIPILIEQLQGSYAETAAQALGKYDNETADDAVLQYARGKVKSLVGKELNYQTGYLLNEILPGHPKLARAEFERVLTQGGVTLECEAAANLQLALLSESAGNLPAAKDYHLNALAVARELNLTSVETVGLYHLARNAYKPGVEAAIANGDHDKALAMLKEYLQIDDSGRAHNFAAWKLAESGVAPDTAVSWAKIANQKVPGKSYMMDTLSWAYYKASDLQAAKEQIDATLQQAMQDAERLNKRLNQSYRYRYAIIHAAVDDTEGALTALRIVFEKTESFNETVFQQKDFQALYKKDKVFQKGFDSLVQDYKLKAPTSE